MDVPRGRRSTLGGLTDAFNNIHLNLGEETGKTSLDSFAFYTKEQGYVLIHPKPSISESCPLKMIFSPSRDSKCDHLFIILNLNSNFSFFFSLFDLVIGRSSENLLFLFRYYWAARPLS